MAVPRTLPADAGWPDASACEYVPGRKGLPLVTVSVAWRALGTVQASELLRNATIGWTRLPGMGEPAYQASQTGTSEVLIGAGSTNVEIKVSGTPRPLDAVVRSVARQVEAGL